MIVLGLAVRDIADEWPTALCLMVGIAAAAAPLIMLLAIRGGVVSQMRGELERFPSSRELVSTGQPVVEWQTVTALGRRPDVAFVAPRTRMLAASAIVERKGRRTAVDLVPSGPGDPLALGWVPGSVTLSDPAASALGVRRGDKVVLVVGRTRGDGTREAERLTLTVAGVLPGAQAGRQLALVGAGLVTATEVYREQADVGSMVEAARIADLSRTERRYAGVRIYARSVDDVAQVRSALVALGIETDSRIDEIRLVQRLDRSLSTVIAVIAAVAAAGLALSLAAAQWGWVERRRADLGYLRLIGLDSRDVMLLPVLMGTLVTVGGLAMAIGLGLIGQHIVNRLFAGLFGGMAQVSAMTGADIVLVSALALAASLIASVFGSLSAGRIGPAAALRGQ